LLGRLYVITDRRLVPDLVGFCDRLLAGVPPGSVLVQLREKDLTGRALVELALALRRVTSAHGAPLLINDRVDIALAVGADGVHLPEAGFDPAEARALGMSLVGASRHAVGPTNADFITFGPVWETPGKGAPVGLELLAAAARASRAPLYALGGIDDADKARRCREAGAHGVAVIRAVACDDPAAAARRLLDAMC